MVDPAGLGLNGCGLQHDIRSNGPVSIGLSSLASDIHVLQVAHRCTRGTVVLGPFGPWTIQYLHYLDWTDLGTVELKVDWSWIGAHYDGH